MQDHGTPCPFKYKYSYFFMSLVRLCYTSAAFFPGHTGYSTVWYKSRDREKFLGYWCHRLRSTDRYSWRSRRTVRVQKRRAWQHEYIWRRIEVRIYRGLYINNRLPHLLRVINYFPFEQWFTKYSQDQIHI